MIFSRHGQTFYLVACIPALVLLIILIITGTGKHSLLPSIIAFLLFGMYYQHCSVMPDSLPIGLHNVTGTISDFPIEQFDKGRTIYTLNDISIDGTGHDYKLRVYVYETDLDYFTGDVVSIDDIKLTIPASVRNPEGFDFRRYLWTGRTALVANTSSAKISIIERKQGLKPILHRLRKELSAKCDDIFLDQSDVMKALLIGDKSSLGEGLYSDFSATGISHVLALSGLHVSLIALLLEWILNKHFCPRLARHFLTSILLILYTVMTGASPSTVRALLMYIITCVTIEMGYYPDVITVMSWTFLLQICNNPLLIDNNGFAVSYASVFAILAFGRPVLRNSESRISKAMRHIFDSARASFSVQIISFPLMASMFYGIPILSVPANMICVPLAVLALYMGFVLLLLGIISVNIAGLLALPVRLCWQIIKAISSFVSALPFSFVLAPVWPNLLVALYAGIAFISSVYMGQSINRKLAGISAMLIISIITILPGKQIDNLHLTVLDVGSADCIVLNAQGNVFLVDAGRDNSVAADFLLRHRANLKGVFLTHTDIDHYGGIFEVLCRYHDIEIYLPECWDRQSPNERITDALYGMDIRYLCAGDSLALSSDVKLNVIWPFEGLEPKNDNDGSLVLAASYSGVDLLLTADIGSQYDPLLTHTGEILKVSHHGSKNATTDEFLDVAMPQTALISVGNNSFGHPSPQVLSRLAAHGCEIYRTDYMGAITIDVFKNGEYSVYPFLSEAK